jgi:hypothetical protein
MTPRLTLGTPSRVRFNLSNTKQKQQEGHGARGASGFHKPPPGGKYPTYLKVVGGATVVGTVALYFHYQNFAPMTNRRRWIASTPEFEKEMGDQVRNKCRNRLDN